MEAGREYDGGTNKKRTKEKCYLASKEVTGKERFSCWLLI